MRVAVVGEHVTWLDVCYILPLNEHVRLADGVGLVIQLLPEYGEPRLRVVLMHPFPCHREHSPRTCCRIVNSPNDTRFGKNVVILCKDEVDHEPDDLTRREVLASGLIGQFGKLADQLLEDGAHVRIADLVRVQVDLAELLGDEVEQVGIGEPVDLGFQLEAGEDVFDVR
jgi:hypothetical protein